MQNIHGIILMVVSMACFSLEDMFIKHLSTSLPTSQILMILGLAGAACFAVLLRIRRGTMAPLVAPVMFSKVMLIRAVAEAGSSLSFVTALALVPLATVTAVFQATPLAITAAAAIFLGDQVGWRRWTAIAVGFSGVLLIIRPGFAGFDALTLLPLLAVVAITFRDLVTRMASPEIPSMAIAFYGFISLALGSVCLIPFNAPWQPLDLWQIGALAGAVGFGVAGYWAIVDAMRSGDTATVMPFRYTRLIFALIIGVAVFGERPDALTLAGAAVIVATGIYMVWRESRLRRA